MGQKVGKASFEDVAKPFVNREWSAWCVSAGWHIRPINLRRKLTFVRYCCTVPYI